MPYSDRHIREAQERVAQQEALVRRMIARGTPTQGAEDRLRQLEQTLSHMKEQHRRSRVFDVQRKIREHRFRSIDRYVYERVRDFLARRHKVAGRGTRRFSCDVVYGECGLLRLERLPLTVTPRALR